jgi:hypothetical protein
MTHGKEFYSDGPLRRESLKPWTKGIMVIFHFQAISWTHTASYPRDTGSDGASLSPSLMQLQHEDGHSPPKAKNNRACHHASFTSSWQISISTPHTGYKTAIINIQVASFAMIYS